MARTKGMLNLSGNLEVNAQAPLDARTIVPTEADLTVANNFPYPYIGLEVYVTGTGKKFRLVNLDTTQSSSWHEVGEGGGGSGLPSGGTAGQYLVKQSATEGDADWQSLSAFTGATSQEAGAAGLVPAPAIGDEGKVLFGNGLWGNIVMPSVDYSQQSVEANIFDTTEKVIGQWIDGKLLYQKAFSYTSQGGSIPGGITADLTTLPNTATVVNLQGVIRRANGAANTLQWINSTYPGYNSSLQYNSGQYKVQAKIGEDANYDIATILGYVQYTKTTDSPLASDEKYAGLTASGEVIYKKHFYTAEITSGNYYDPDLTFAKLIKVEGYCEHFDGENSEGFMTFPQYFGSSAFEGVAINVKSNMAKTKIVVYYKTVNYPSNRKIRNVNLDVYYTKSS